MNLGDHARIFPETFGQECLDNIAIKALLKEALIYKFDLIEEEACNCLTPQKI